MKVVFGCQTMICETAWPQMKTESTKTRADDTSALGKYITVIGMNFLALALLYNLLICLSCRFSAVVQISRFSGKIERRQSENSRKSCNLLFHWVSKIPRRCDEEICIRLSSMMIGHAWCELFIRIYSCQIKTFAFGRQRWSAVLLTTTWENQETSGGRQTRFLCYSKIRRL